MATVISQHDKPNLWAKIDIYSLNLFLFCILVTASQSNNMVGQIYIRREDSSYPFSRAVWKMSCFVVSGSGGGIFF